jgi:hypothetical protein
MRIAALLVGCFALVLAIVAMPHPWLRRPMDREAAIAKFAELAKGRDLNTQEKVNEFLNAFFCAIKEGDSIEECGTVLAAFEKPYESHGTLCYDLCLPVKPIPGHPDGTGLILYVHINQETKKVEWVKYGYTSD